MRPDRLLPTLAASLLLLLVVAVAWQWRHGPPVAADLLALLPAGADDALVARAEARMREPVDRQLVLLVGHREGATAVALASRIGEQWQASGSFATVQWRFGSDLAALRQALASNRLALLPAASRQQLATDPAGWIDARTAQLFDPFSGSLLPPQQDWLGLGAQAQTTLLGGTRLSLDSASGTLSVTAEGVTWVLLRADNRGAFDLDSPLALAARVAAARKVVTDAGGELLATGGALYAAAGQSQASRESSLIGGLSLAGMVLLLLLLYRRLRVLFALLPMLVAVAAGSAACVALFGSINALTLVLGASLIGVAADFPQHYLSKSWAGAWSSWPAVRRVAPGLALSLATNLIGYLALALTPFPALTQVAVFSAAGLLAAWLCAVALLPACFAGMTLHPPGAPLRLAARALALRARLLTAVGSRALLALALLFCLGGLWQLESRNDVRQWLDADPALARDATRIAALTGEQPTSQFFLVRAATPAQLLERQRELTRQLDAAVAAGDLQGYRALSQLAATEADLASLRQSLRTLPAHWSGLVAAGVPEPLLRAELEMLLAQPPVPLAEALASELGEPWRPLWLGADPQQAEGEVAGLIALQGRPAADAMQAAADTVAGARYVDRLAALDQLFAATQWRAAALKLAACAAMLLLLWRPFGGRGALRVVTLPVLAAVAAAATLGWLQQPLTVFSLFGLLLITALGVDYAILMREGIGGPAVCLLGTLLAAATSWLAFGLLALSGTPVIANFGLAVSAGLLFSFLLAPWATTPGRDTSTHLPG